MAIQNGRFDVAGDGPGLAQGWFLFTYCQAERWVAFGPPPLDAQEGFERWSKLRRAFVASDVVLHFFGNDGREAFERGWQNDIFAVELSPALSVTWTPNGAAAEAFGHGLVWRSSWSAVTSQPAAFVGPSIGRESFEGAWLNNTFRSNWSLVEAVWAPFGAGSVETFSGIWPKASTV